MRTLENGCDRVIATVFFWKDDRLLGHVDYDLATLDKIVKHAKNYGKTCIFADFFNIPKVSTCFTLVNGRWYKEVY